MSASKPFAGVNRILCPTDLSVRSQNTLAYARQVATALNAKLTAFHSAVDSWLYQTDGLSGDEVEQIESAIRAEIIGRLEADSDAIDLDVIVERSSNPATAIPRLVRSLGIDLIIMKARPGILSALHFGSIVERVISAADCPVMLVPSRFLAGRDLAPDKLKFQRILFDYDFAQATDGLFHIADCLTRSYGSELHVVSVLEPPRVDLEAPTLTSSEMRFETAVQMRLNSAVRAIGISTNDVLTKIEWGSHSERILKYAADHKIDLICTTLPDPGFYIEKVYRTYLGQLLAAAECPILVKQCV